MEKRIYVQISWHKLPNERKKSLNNKINIYYYLNTQLILFASYIVWYEFYIDSK